MSRKDETKNAIKDYEDRCVVCMDTIPDGPWKKEPNRIEFEHMGLPCLMIRHAGLLHWCGYVGIPKTHKYYGKGYSEIPDMDVHGGLTYAEKCHGHICHITKDNDDLWWFGFDCAHHQDLIPYMQKHENEIPRIAKSLYNLDSIYRNASYVISEARSLAEQLKKAA